MSTLFPAKSLVFFKEKTFLFLSKEPWVLKVIMQHLQLIISYILADRLQDFSDQGWIWGWKCNSLVKH